MHKEIIEDLYKRRSQFLDPEQGPMMARMLNTVSKDIYTESQRFVFELIQNADDSSFDFGNEVHFDFLDGVLIISHNGKPFTKEDVGALTNSGDSTKKSDPNQTGYKGIGFKSVFAKSKRVTILSGGFQFRFDKEFHKTELPWQIIPIWTELTDLPQSVQESMSKIDYGVSTILEMNKAGSLETELSEVLSNGQILLFLRKVSKISISMNGGFQYSIEKKIISQNIAFNNVTLLKNDKVISNWIVKTFERIPVPDSTKAALAADEDTPDKLKEINITEISFAVKIEEGVFKNLTREERLIFTYLPTKVTEMNFPFIVNGNFITNASREALHKDSAWNQWLLELVAEKNFEWLELLATSTFCFQVLRLLPDKFIETYDKLKAAFNIGYDKNSKLRKFIVSEDTTPKRVTEVIYDRTSLSHQPFISIDSIIEYIAKEKKGVTFSKSSFVNTKVQQPDKLKALGVQTFELENFESFFISEAFTARHTVEQNFELINFLKLRSDSDDKGDWYQMMKTLPFIFDEKNKLRNPVTGICFPTGAFNAATELGDIPVIHEYVFKKIEQSEIIYEWLKKLGVKEPSETAFITNYIIPNLQDETFITSSNFLKFTIYLHKMYKAGLLTEEIIESLREFKIKIKGLGDNFEQAQHCFLSNVYYPELRLEEVIKDISYVSEEYLVSKYNANEWNVFFSAIRVKKTIDIETINANNSLATVTALTDEEWVDLCETSARRAGGFGFHSRNEIGMIKLPAFLNFITENLEYSKIFWKYMISNGNGYAELSTPAIFRYGTGRGYNGYSTNVPNYFLWFVSNKQCIPTTSQGLHYAKDVYENIKEIKNIAGDHFPVFDCEERPTDGWAAMFKFKNRLAIEDYLTILKLMCDEAKVEPITKSTVSRIGLIYNKLSDLLPDFAEDTKEMIKQWADKNMLLTVGNTFTPAQQLKWITIEGFTNDSGELQIISIPENCKKEKLKGIMQLLGVQIIEEFFPELQNGHLDSSLKHKFQEVLPYFAAYIQKKKLDNSTDEFERLFEILNTMQFYTSDEITLSFKHLDTVVKGPTVTVFKEGDNFYFRGLWSKERILLNFIKELSDAIGVSDYSEVLRFLLLEKDKEEVLAWVKEMNIEPSTIKQKKYFTIIPANIPQSPSIAPVEFNDEGIETSDDIEPYESDDQESSQPAVHFVPFTSFKDFDMSKITSSARSFSVEEPKEEVMYGKIESQQLRSEVGYFCEGLVNKYLNEEENGFTEINWENESEESGKPFDFSIMDNGVKKYIDVKGTLSSDKDVVYLSSAEWKFMLEHGSNYSIYRVFDANKENPRIELINNPANLLRLGKILPTETSLRI